MQWYKLKRRVDAEANKSKRLLKALKKVAPFVPEEIAKDLYVFVPSRDTLGAVFSIIGTVMYLRLPKRGEPQSEVDFTVAHEFAHLVLQHPQNHLPEGKRVENQANKLAESWGFHTDFE